MLKPVNGFVLLRFLPLEEKTSGGIHLPGSATIAKRAEVLAVFDPYKRAGSSRDEVLPVVEPGNIVLLSPGAEGYAVDISVPAEQLLHQSDILAKVPPA